MLRNILSTKTVLGTALSLGNYGFRQLPFLFLHPLQWVTFVSGILIFRTLPNRRNYSPFVRITTIICFYGLLLSLIRYWFYYQGTEFGPIIRHTTAFLLGMLSLLTFQSQIIQSKYESFFRMITLTSIFPLTYGLLQIVSGKKIGYYHRISSFFSEPSYYGDYLVLILIPAVISSSTYFLNSGRKYRILLTYISLTLLLNLFFIQSGTTILKLGTFIILFIFIFPIPVIAKFTIAGLFSLFGTYIVFYDQGYVNAIWRYVHTLIENPDLFFSWEYYTIYDRFYSIYAALLHLFSPAGILGLGFGGDYYEFKNLFPPSIHNDLMNIKPTLSFFTSFSAKAILYFGFPGLIWLGWILVRSYRSTEPIIRIGALSVLIASLWGIGNFSLPYVWLWIACVFSSPKDMVNRKT